MLNLREGHSLPQNIIQTITSGFKSLVEVIHEVLKIKIRNSSAKYPKTVTNPATDNSVIFTDMNEVFSDII